MTMICALVRRYRAEKACYAEDCAFGKWLGRSGEFQDLDPENAGNGAGCVDLAVVNRLPDPNAVNTEQTGIRVNKGGLSGAYERPRAYSWGR